MVTEEFVHMQVQNVVMHLQKECLTLETLSTCDSTAGSEMLA